MDRIRSFAWRPHTTAILLSGFALIIVALTISFIVNTFQATVSVQIGAGTYNVGLADTESERRQGLSGVSSLGMNGGLLMDFKQNGQWSIWMKDMELPIDIIWLSEAKKVVYIVRNADPSLGTRVTYTPDKPARYVLELPAGSVQRSAIKLGQTAYFIIEGIEE
jgi:uncharacterized protein